MSSDDDDFDPMFDGGGGAAKKPVAKSATTNGATKAGKANGVGGGDGGKKRLSVERIYQKKSQLEHILLRPDTYIGSVNPVTEKMWVLDADNQRIVNKEITYVPGLYKIFDEILVNAADNKQRDPKMDTIRIDINAEKNEIKVFNNGRGIPVEMHKDEKMYVPTLIFGHLLTSSNFNDEEEKVTGGRNGYGAKLCNVFSTKFVVETASKENRKEFKQVWENNMSKAKEAKLKDFSAEDYTRITFCPDLPKFNMESLDPDTVALLSRRAYDIAASSKGVKVLLNGKRIPVKNFKDYVDFFIKGHEDETGNPVKAIYEQAHERWEVAVAVSDNGFQQMSFVNSIATTKGGRHVDYISKMIENNIAEILKKKNKGGVTIKPHQIRNHIWLFINCLIVNPTFDSQTKENMTLQVNKFGSKCAMTPKFYTQLSKSGVVESVLAWSKFKADQEMKSKHSSKKTNKLKGISKLEDANDAGTKNSIDCTLILTEGDSAKTLAVAGLGVVGRDKYGVYPLRGKLLNVREATHKQIMENKEINEMVKIIGLTYKKKYNSIEDLKSLRYGRLMIMTDQDQDGSHIKGLLINFIHHNWPSLLRLPFLEEFITPIVKATKGSSSLSFFSMPELQEWKSQTDNWHTYKIKYYKGLGTSTSKEAKDYFSDMNRHRILFMHESDQDDHAINMAFSKKAVDQRKEWLTTWMEECKRRKELGLSEIYLYEKQTKSVTYSDFINKELVLFSNLDNERSIPSVVDGFKPGQRKVMFTCLKRNDKREVKVAQLAGSVGEMSAYHHGEASLMGTIINLAQNYVGSNNVNLLQPIGQFGTRLAGGKDHASPRYIFTQMSPLARLIFNPNDDAILNYLTDDNQKIEPEWYMPILPMVLVNGADGIGTGWMTKIPNYNPREIVQNLLRMLEGHEPEDMNPWFKNFKGHIESLENQRYVVNGEIASISDNKIEITELPIRTWTQSYKEQVMEPMLNGSDKIPAIIQDYKEYHTDVTVKFIVQMNSDKLRQAELDKGLHQFFKLQTTISTSSMVLFDAKGCLRKYEGVLDIMREFFHLRLEFYGKRKDYMEGMLEAEALKLSNQARFILEKCDGTLVVENKKRKAMIDELHRKGFDSDPVKKWKIAQKLDDVAESDSEEDQDGGDLDYDYLLGMAMWSLTKERKDDLLKKKDEKHQELRHLRDMSKEDLWKKDLSEFIEKLDEVEAKELEDQKSGVSKDKALKGMGKKKKVKEEALPSPVGIRIIPRIAEELKNKAAKAAAAKTKKGEKLDKKALKETEEEKDEFDFMCDDKDMNRSLSEKLGLSAAPNGIKKATKHKKTTPLSSTDSSPRKKPKMAAKGKSNPWDDDSDEESDPSDKDFSFDDSDSEF
ncbi:DNA topoisomerase 2-alpha-like [Tigriopus californicus]|uniref:DNA topoisomerase 2-alpha-like n=1 Tax=Tigriopus californicus TaxID=6832 RepID=UPI0027DA5079|nr:DNA topoisomerase 2-alpha-like [Tigriopus californicus]